MELNRDEIIKALECCSSSDGVSACESGCPYWGGDYDTCPCIEEPNFIIKNALALINQLTEENERLIVTLKMNDAPFPEGLQIVHDFCEKGKRKARADTVREMQTRLAQYIGTYTEKSFVYVSAMFKLIDRIAKEMLEGNTTTDNKCIACGEIIPEGRQVCPNCEGG